MVDKSLALEVISRNPWAALVLSFDGHIAEVVAFPSELTAETLLEFTRTHARGRRFRLMRQATLTEAQLDAVIAEMMRPGEPRRARAADGPGLPDDKHFWSPFSGARALASVITALIMRRSR